MRWTGLLTKILLMKNEHFTYASSVNRRRMTTWRIAAVPVAQVSEKV